MFLVAFLLEGFEFIAGLARLFLNASEEVDETLCIVLKKLFGASKTHLAHVLVLHKLGDFLVLGLDHVLNEEHLAFFLDQLPARFTVLGSFDGNVHATSFRYLDFALHLRIYG